ncbi:hypothetical protein LCGC14_1759360 [marine sediment metagenome]|uniref:Uncharacterized protein n=1 Tax=marine sediment metagenome TaxID=412755 RepID=A0A0F9HNT9_9ZZZZ
MTRSKLRRRARAKIRQLGWRALLHDNPGLRVFKKVSFAKRLQILDKVRA